MVTTNSDYKKVTLSLKPEDYEVLRFVAFKRKTSVAGVVREMIQEVLDDEEDIRDGLKVLAEKKDTMDWDTFKKEHLGL